MEKIIGGKSITDWEQQWQDIGSLNEQNVAGLNDTIGVFAVKDKISGKIYAIGAGTEYTNGGLRKRLMDFIRLSDSARSHFMGQKINKHLKNIRISVIKTGSDETKVEPTYQLRNDLIEKYNPEWNKK